jgi:hypothetical protein
MDETTCFEHLETWHEVASMCSRWSIGLYRLSIFHRAAGSRNRGLCFRPSGKPGGRTSGGARRAHLGLFYPALAVMRRRWTSDYRSTFEKG